MLCVIRLSVIMPSVVAPRSATVKMQMPVNAQTYFLQQLKFEQIEQRLKEIINNPSLMNESRWVNN